MMLHEVLPKALLDHIGYKLISREAKETVLILRLPLNSLNFKLALAKGPQTQVIRIQIVTGLEPAKITAAQPADWKKFEEGKDVTSPGGQHNWRRTAGVVEGIRASAGLQ